MTAPKNPSMPWRANPYTLKSMLFALALGLPLVSGCVHVTPPESELERLKEEKEVRQQQDFPGGDLLRELARDAVNALNH
jgi:hypothetical protein